MVEAHEVKMVSLERRAAEAHGRGHDKPIIDLEGGQYGKYRRLKRTPLRLGLLLSLYFPY